MLAYAAGGERQDTTDALSRCAPHFAVFRPTQPNPSARRLRLGCAARGGAVGGCCACHLAGCTYLANSLYHNAAHACVHFFAFADFAQFSF